MIARQNLTDAATAIEEDDQTEITLIKNQLSQDINKLETDLQSVLGTLADKDDVPVDWLLQYREDAKRNIREFKNALQLLEEKSASMQSKQTPQMGPTTAPPRWQMPVLNKTKAAARRNLFSENQADSPATPRQEQQNTHNLGKAAPLSQPQGYQTRDV